MYSIDIISFLYFFFKEFNIGADKSIPITLHELFTESDIIFVVNPEPHPTSKTNLLLDKSIS